MGKQKCIYTRIHLYSGYTDGFEFGKVLDYARVGNRTGNGKPGGMSCLFFRVRVADWYWDIGK